MNDSMLTKIKIAGCAAIAVVSLTTIGVSAHSIANKQEDNGTIAVDIEMPKGYDHGYTEDIQDYENLMAMEDIDWETYKADPLEKYTTVTVDDSIVNASFMDTTTSFHDNSSSTSKFKTEAMSMSDEEKIMLSENEAWKLISGGLYQGYPSGNFMDNKLTLTKIRNNNTKTITVKCWYWEDPSDDTNFNKVTKTKVFAVNASIASLFEHAFEDIYNDPSKPILNLGDGGMGTWVIRGKNHNPYARMSTHSLGCCIDINPSTGSFYVNGKWYGNAYGQNTMSKAIWNQLPECHKKYHVLYDGCPIVEIFKSYGFVWGGDWHSSKDCMHLSWIGEGSNTRAQGQQLYSERKKK